MQQPPFKTRPLHAGEIRKITRLLCISNNVCPSGFHTAIESTITTPLFSPRKPEHLRTPPGQVSEEVLTQVKAKSLAVDGAPK